MKKVFVYWLITILLVQLTISCENESSSQRIQYVTTQTNLDSPKKKAEDLFNESVELLMYRIKIQDSNRVKAVKINEQIINKLTEAHEIDTLFRDPIFLASECTMFARDYKECIIWTSKLKQVDTSSKNLIFCIDRIQFCNEKLKTKSKH